MTNFWGPLHLVTVDLKKPAAPGNIPGDAVQLRWNKDIQITSDYWNCPAMNRPSSLLIRCFKATPATDWRGPSDRRFPWLERIPLQRRRQDDHYRRDRQVITPALGPSPDSSANLDRSPSQIATASRLHPALANRNQGAEDGTRSP